MLRFDRKQKNSVKQLSFNKKYIKKKKKKCKNSTNEISLMDLTLIHIHFLTISDWLCVSLKKCCWSGIFYFLKWSSLYSHFNPWFKCYPFGKSHIL